MSKYRIKVLIIQILIIIGFLLLWQIGANTGVIDSFIFSSPLKVLSTFNNLIQRGMLFKHILTTLTEVFISFSLGILIAFIISIIMYLNKLTADIFDPFLTMLNSLPKVALGPIIIIWVGANTNAIITMALMINVIISIITIYTGFVNTDELKIKLFETLNF